MLVLGLVLILCFRKFLCFSQSSFSISHVQHYVSMLTMEKKNSSYKLHYLLHSSALIEKCLSTKLKPLGLGPRQARVIGALERMGPTSQIDLARECSITAASMSTMTSRMINAGYVSREIDPIEARRNTLTLTPRGLALFDDIGAVWAEVDDVIDNAIGIEKSNSLTSLARELRNALGGHAPGDRRS